MKYITLLIILCGICLGTISTETSRMALQSGNDSSTTFTFDFPITDTSDMAVYIRTTSTGVEVLQAETTDYALSATNNDYSSGGTVTFVTAPATGESVLLIRDTPMTQDTTLSDTGVLRLAALEDAFDKLTKLVQENNEQNERSIRFPVTDTTSLTSELGSSVDRADQYLSFDSSGNATTTSVLTTGSASISSYGETLIAAANASSARTILVSVIGSDVQAWDTQLDDIAALAVTNSNIIVGDGSNWVAESGATALTSLGAMPINGGTAWSGTGSGFRDEDTMSSNDATAAASQQSIKAYIDTNLDFSDIDPNDSEPTAMLKAQAYLAATDGFVVASLQGTSTAAEDLKGYIGSTTDPAGAGDLIAMDSPGVNNDAACIAFSVAAGEYFEITATGVPTIYWRSRGAYSAPVDQD